MLRYLPQIITRKGNLSTEHEMRSQGGLAPNDSWIRLPFAWRSSLSSSPVMQPRAMPLEPWAPSSANERVSQTRWSGGCIGGLAPVV